jgi:ribosomal protein S18 acetylase RimI-like enzyme
MGKPFRFTQAMIIVSKSTKEEIKPFNAKEWVATDVKYYGKGHDWIEKEFVFKAVENGEIVGTIYGKFAAGVLYIDDLIVTKAKRGLGVGRMLMEKAEEFGKSMKAHKAYLITGGTWREARGFYEKMGYKKTGDFINHYHNSDFVIYEKNLI